MMTYKTLKAAYSDGWHDKRREEYGGEGLILKGHTLTRNHDLARSATDWAFRGYRVKPGEQPIAYLTRNVGKLVTYGVYRADQVEPRIVKGPITPPVQVDVLAALWAINRHAKRLRDRGCGQYDDLRRDLARKTAAKKRDLYRRKGQALAHLLAEGLLTVSGYHVFGDDRWAEVLEGAGYRFHRPCPPPRTAVEHLSLDGIEAKPRARNEPRLRDAILTLDRYLDGKSALPVFAWPSKPTHGHETWDDDDDPDRGTGDEEG